MSIKITLRRNASHSYLYDVLKVQGKRIQTLHSALDFESAASLVAAYNTAIPE